MTLTVRSFSVAVLFTGALLLNAGRAAAAEHLIEVSGHFVLSDEEKQFIQALPPLQVMVDDNFLPLSIYDSKTSTFRGIAVDLFVYVALRLGIKYNMMYNEKLTWSDKVALFNRRDIDMLMPTSYTAGRAEYGVFSASFYEGYYVAIAKKARNMTLVSSFSLAGYKVGVTKATAIIPFVLGFVNPDQVYYYDNQMDLYSAIRSGQIDFGLRHRYAFEEEMLSMELFDLSIAHTIIESPRKYSFYFVKNEQNKKLVEIIDRYMATLSYVRLVNHYDKGMDELVNRYNTERQQKTRLLLTVLGGSALLVVLVAAWLYYRRLSLKLSEAYGKLESMSMTDALTGLGNRRNFDEVLQREYSRHARTGAPMSLIMLDIDFFKQYNDTYGHVQGDECLKQVADVIKKCVSRGSDFSARYGGEEFVCILPDTGLEGALNIAGHIRRELMALAIPHAGSAISGVVTASFGVAVAGCSMAGSALGAVAQVDALLLRAKARGRNRIESSQGDDHAPSCS